MNRIVDRTGHIILISSRRMRCAIPLRFISSSALRGAISHCILDVPDSFRNCETLNVSFLNPVLSCPRVRAEGAEEPTEVEAMAVVADVVSPLRVVDAVNTLKVVDAEDVVDVEDMVMVSTRRKDFYNHTYSNPRN